MRLLFFAYSKNLLYLCTQINITPMKHLLYIVFHVLIWIGAVSILLFVAMELLMNLTLQDVIDVLTQESEPSGRLIILVYFLLGLYVSIIAFHYAYCQNYPVHPLRLLVRIVVSFLTLVFSAIPIIFLFLIAITHLSSTDLSFLVVMVEIAGLFSPLSVTTLCIYVFVKSLPRVYYKNLCIPQTPD